VIEVIVGLEASYWNEGLAWVICLPALSVQVPVMVAVVESPPEYVVEPQAAIPENELPVTFAVTGVVCQ
jgi:hypothetical protein